MAFPFQKTTYILHFQRFLKILQELSDAQRTIGKYSCAGQSRIVSTRLKVDGFRRGANLIAAFYLIFAAPVP
jgi:hypothetical protein